VHTLSRGGGGTTPEVGSKDETALEVGGKDKTAVEIGGEGRTTPEVGSEDKTALEIGGKGGAAPEIGGEGRVAPEVVDEARSVLEVSGEAGATGNAAGGYSLSSSILIVGDIVDCTSSGASCTSSGNRQSWSKHLGWLRPSRRVRKLLWSNQNRDWRQRWRQPRLSSGERKLHCHGTQHAPGTQLNVLIWRQWPTGPQAAAGCPR